MKTVGLIVSKIAEKQPEEVKKVTDALVKSTTRRSSVGF